MTSSVNIFMSEYLSPSDQGDWPEPTKFDKLRIKTETQLIHLIDAELDLGIRDVRQAFKSAETWAVAQAVLPPSEKCICQSYQLDSAGCRDHCGRTKSGGIESGTS